MEPTAQALGSEGVAPGAGSISDRREPLMPEPLKVELPISRRERRARLRLLIGSYIILFLRYTIATFLSSFFTSYPPGVDFSGTMDGLIFAAYPLGMALTSF